MSNVQVTVSLVFRMGNQSSAFNFKYFSAVEGPEFDYNPDYNQSRLHSDYTLFYLGIALCALLAALVLALNLALGCCSPWEVSDDNPVLGMNGRYIVIKGRPICSRKTFC